MDTPSNPIDKQIIVQLAIDLQQARDEIKKLKRDRNLSNEKTIGDTHVFIKVLEQYNLTEENDLLYGLLKSRFVCDYCANGGCGMRPDGVECKDCYQTLKETEWDLED